MCLSLRVRNLQSIRNKHYSKSSCTTFETFIKNNMKNICMYTDFTIFVEGKYDSIHLLFTTTSNEKVPT